MPQPAMNASTSSLPSNETLDEIINWLTNQAQNAIADNLMEHPLNKKSMMKTVNRLTQLRELVYLLLPTTEQRRLFVRFTGNTQNLPSVKHLFGLPPFFFAATTSENASGLAAAGFAASRVNLAYKSNNFDADNVLAPPATQFKGQFYTEEGFEFVVTDQFYNKHPTLPNLGTVNDKIAVFIKREHRLTKWPTSGSIYLLRPTRTFYTFCPQTSHRCMVVNITITNRRTTLGCILVL